MNREKSGTNLSRFLVDIAWISPNNIFVDHIYKAILPGGSHRLYSNMVALSFETLLKRYL